MGVTKQSESDGDCLACRLVSSGGLLGASAYVWYHSRHLKGLGKLAAYSLCGGLCYLGCARFARLPPFLHKWRGDVRPSVPSHVTVNSVSQLSQLTRPFLQLDVACTLNAIGYPGKINVLAPTAHPGMHSRAINAYSRSLISAHGGVQVDSLSPWFNFQPFYLADMQKKSRNFYFIK